MKFWVDMDNAPHVHVLRPIIVELQRRGHQVAISARDYGQTIPLLKMYGLEFKQIGRHSGKNKVGKYIAFVARSCSLLIWAIGKRFDAIICHGSRAVFPAARLIGVPLIVLGDYEHASLPRFMCHWIRLMLVPDVMPASVLTAKGIPACRVHGYPGLKEDLYVHDFQPNPLFAQEMGIQRDRVLILLRPPATMAHYAVKASERLFYEVLAYLSSREDVQVVLLPRTRGQSEKLRSYLRKQGYANILIPEKVYNGPSLIWYSDLVISGGGTMNREASSLGVPVLSIFQGRIGAVDRHLVEAGKLMHAATIQQVKSIPLVKSSKRDGTSDHRAGVHVRDFLVDEIVRAGAERSGR